MGCFDRILGTYVNPAKFNNTGGSYNTNPGIFPGFDMSREMAVMEKMEDREDRNNSH